MKTGTRLLAAGLGVSLVLAASAMALADKETMQAKLAKAAPQFTLLDTTGQERSLADYKGKVVLLEWINPKCPFVQNCYKSKAIQEAFLKASQTSKGLVWLAINTTPNTSAEENNNWIRKHGLKYPILLDSKGEVARLYNAKTTPHMFVIDREGVLRYHGAIDNNKLSDKSRDEVFNYVTNAITQMAAQETVSPDYVKSYGCSVRYKKSW